MKIVCPHCGISGKTADSLAGREVACPKCGEKFIASDAGIKMKHQQVTEEKPAATTTEKNREEGGEDILVPVESPDFTISEILREIWEFVRDRRFALVCRMGTVLMWGVMVAIAWLTDSESGPLIQLVEVLGLPSSVLIVCGYLLPIISMGLSSNAQAGLSYLSVRQRLGEQVGIKTCLRGFDARHFTSIFIAGILKTILVMLGLLLIFPGIYLSIAYMFVLPLIIDRGLKPWQAMELSRQAVTKAWFRVFGIYIILTGLPALISFLLFSQLLVGVWLQFGQLGKPANINDIVGILLMYSSSFFICLLLIFVIWLFMFPYICAIYGVLYDKLFITQRMHDRRG